MAGIEQLEIHSKAYIVRWVKVDAGHTISWSVQPHKKSINFAIVKHPGTGGTNLMSHSDDLGGFEQHTDGVAESKAGLFGKRDVSTAQDQLAKKGFIPIKWHGKCEADKVSVGTYDVTQGGMFGLVFDNTFSKQTSKTATFVLLTYPTGAPPQTARHLPNLQAGPAASTSRSSLGKSNNSPRLGAVTSDSVDSLHSGPQRGRALSTLSAAGKSDSGASSSYHVGVLLKRRRKKGQGYARRFFSLDYTTCTLSYYHSRTSSALRGAIPLSLAAIAADERRREITIDSGAEVWHLRASNAKEFTDWARALERASKIARGLESVVDEPTSETQGDHSASSQQAGPATTRNIQQEEDRDWEHVESLVSRIVGTRDALRRLVKDLAAEKRPVSSHGMYLSPSTPTVPEDSDGYFPSSPQPADRRSFWKRKASGSASPLTPQSFQSATAAAASLAVPTAAAAASPASGAATPNLNGAKSYGPLQGDRDTHDSCAALLKDLDSVVVEFSSLLNTSKRRRIPLQAAAAPRRSLESTTSTVEEFFDAEAGDSDKSQNQVLLIDRRSEEDEGEETPASEAEEEEVSIDDSSSISSVEDNEAQPAADGADSLFPAKPKSLTPLPITDAVARRKTIPPAKVAPPSLIAFVRKNVGKDLSTISMPVSANEPVSLLQRMAEQLEYAPLLDAAARQDQASHRLLYVAAFAISQFSNGRAKERAIRKPFNPLLGETFELVRSEAEVPGGLRLLVEKVSHRPWSFAQSPAPTQKFWGKSAELTTEGRVRVSLRLATGGDGDDAGSQEEHYSWNTATVFLRNVVMGEKYVEPVGTMHVCNDTTGAKATVEFRSKGVFGGRGEEVYVDTVGPDGDNLGVTMSGTWTNALKMQPGNREVWKAGSLVDKPATTYGLTTFAASLNEITALEKGKLPPTDCRLRPDQRLAEQGELDEAEEWKVKLEEAQRQRRRVMEEQGEEWKPRWFTKVPTGQDAAGSGGGGEEVWRLKGGKDGYWEERAKGQWSGRREQEQRGIRIAIDRGGTFTDCVGTYRGQDVVIKLLSEDPANYADAPLEGIRRIMSHFSNDTNEIPRGTPLDTARIESIRMGTTVATNALLERKGEEIALVVTQGFGDCLVIGNQSRPKIFDLAIRKPDVLFSRVVEVEERVTLEDYAEDPERTVTKVDGKAGGLNSNGSGTAADDDLVMGLSGEVVRILRRPAREKVREQLQAVYDSGIRSVAVCLMHAYTFPDHEALVGEVAREIGFAHVSLSHELMPMIKLVPRATSVCADAYLTPAIKRYIEGFQAGFEGGLGSKSVRDDAKDATASSGGSRNKGARCEFMQSDGGLVDVDRFTGLRAILSGPAGGVVGYAITSYDEKTKIPVIGFDMGGTSTDVSRYGDGRYDHTFETTTAGVTIQSPQLDINTVAAGGGSMLFFKNGMFVVGPESAGAHPGPACYRKGGPATVTDANLFLGRLLPEFFPKIFGPNEDQGLDPEASRKVLQALADQIHDETGKKMDVDEVAYGFLTVANEAMTRPIRSITEAKGHDTSRHRLATFGGAGGQHAVAIAASLGIKQILIHRYSSVLSAYGMALADVVDERQEPDSTVWTGEREVVDQLKRRLDGLKAKSREALRDQGFEDDDQVVFEEYLNMRYRGTESALMIIKPGGDEEETAWDYGKAFVEHHRYEFGFTLDERDIIVDDVRVRGIGKSFRYDKKTVDEQLQEVSPKDVSASKQHSEADVYFEGGRVKSPVYKLGDLDVGEVVKGPAMLADGTQTIVVTPRTTALVLDTHVIIDLSAAAADKSSSEKATTTDTPNPSSYDDVDPIMLSIFGHRFMAIAEQMGRALQKTSVSTNVKERLDFSCAIFDAHGGLVANAPHLPVHLGSMSTCVRRQAEIWKGRLSKGDVIITNHPSYGGTHLPDVTLVMPAFNAAGDKILFYAASRAHHADIGGITAGSMPPHSRELHQEGAAIKSEKLVSQGRFNEERVVQLFYDEPAQHPGCSGTRCLADNINDLRAQVSANQKGISLIEGLIAEYGEATVQFYMVAIQHNAEQQVRALLRTVHTRFQGRDLTAEDFMDDGSPIRLRITIDPDLGAAVFDFAGTGPEVYANINAPQAISYSAIIYALRCMISEDIPLNQGCLAPITVLIPPKSLLSPSDNAAVVGGNVLTSQRITDVIFRAFQACAASQGDCNNLTFGFGGNVTGQTAVRGFGYYETIAGGSGAGPTWEGTDGVHVHMTNTRITDAEVFERRYPVLLREFSIRRGSGGEGQHRGGHGVVRDIEFRIPLQVSILSERRVYHPYGMAGGGEGACGLNLWVRKVKKAKWESNLRRLQRSQAEDNSTAGQNVTGDEGDEKEDDEYEERFINLGAKNSAPMQAGDRIIIHTPGGGAWGKVGEPKAPGAERSNGQGQKGGREKEATHGWKKGSYAAREELALQA
ncbi:putative oxysterol binding protein [Dichotomopilus funicola]|uniref:Oxysterol binding protein n=1 Tax=Dichotomopilus funicola TaxID=1934379 RepID=A0AAN6V3N2_9PEZI|nr:putative oxysterol binding protein [Dichotomopilus funicola]